MVYLNILIPLKQKMRTSQKYFFEKWNPVIREQFRLSRDFQIEACIDLFGGYWLAPQKNMHGWMPG